MWQRGLSCPAQCAAQCTRPSARDTVRGTVHAAVQRAAANFSRRRTLHSAVLQQLGAQSAFDTGGGWSFTCLQLAHTLGNLLPLQVKAFWGESCWLESGCMWCEGEGGG